MSRVNKDSLESQAQALLSNLFAAINHKGSEENEYVMKSIMRTLSLLEEKMLPVVEIVVSTLTQKLLLVAKVLVGFNMSLHVCVIYSPQAIEKNLSICNQVSIY